MENYPRIQAQYDYCWNIFSQKYPEYDKPRLEVRWMKKSWGITHLGLIIWISINKDLEPAKDFQIQHVIFHEFCHLKYHNHSREFYDMLDEFDPMAKKQVEKVTNVRLQKLLELEKSLEINKL